MDLDPKYCIQGFKLPNGSKISHQMLVNVIALFLKVRLENLQMV
jgi:hypothetical protein